MKQKIVIITSKYLHPFVEKAFEDFKEDCTVTIADYTNFDHITDIYRKYEKTADGFMISGTTAMAAIEHHIGEFQKPVISFHADLIIDIRPYCVGSIIFNCSFLFFIL